MEEIKNVSLTAKQIECLKFDCKSYALKNEFLVCKAIQLYHNGYLSFVYTGTIILECNYNTLKKIAKKTKTTLTIETGGNNQFIISFYASFEELPRTLK